MVADLPTALPQIKAGIARGLATLDVRAGAGVGHCRRPVARLARAAETGRVEPEHAVPPEPVADVVSTEPPTVIVLSAPLEAIEPEPAEEPETPEVIALPDASEDTHQETEPSATANEPVPEEPKIIEPVEPVSAEPDDVIPLPPPATEPEADPERAETDADEPSGELPPVVPEPKDCTRQGVGEGRGRSHGRWRIV